MSDDVLQRPTIAVINRREGSGLGDSFAISSPQPKITVTVKNKARREQDTDVCEAPPHAESSLQEKT